MGVWIVTMSWGDHCASALEQNALVRKRHCSPILCFGTSLQFLPMPANRKALGDNAACPTLKAPARIVQNDASPQPLSKK
jgi:hypothetical protein